MGTSSARRGPTSRLWRMAKATAFRYLSPERAGARQAREVVARYRAALKETDGHGDETGLAAFRLTRKVAQNLGDFWDRASSLGWEAALAARGLAGAEGQSPEVLAQGLSAGLVGPGGGLEEAVARVSLAAVLRRHLHPEGTGPAAPLAALKSRPAQVVREFLGAALYTRLVLDLGESLEAASPGFGPLKSGLDGIKGWLESAGDTPPGEAPLPGRWQGLAGWVWVSQALGMLISRLSSSQSDILG